MGNRTFRELLPGGVVLKDTPVSTGDYVQSVEFDTQRRRALGIYYTPRNAAAILAKWAIRSKHDTVLEPSFGGCTILEAALNQLRSLNCSCPEKQIFGFDVDESAFGYLRRLLGKTQYPGFSLQDFLRAPSGQLAVTTIIANPPFVSYHRMNKAQRDTVRSWRERYKPPFAMTASLWAYFLIHSLSFLKPNGRIAFILPSAATSSDYAQPIMDMLGGRFARLMVYRMNEQLFIQAGAEERTVVLLADGYLNNKHTKAQRSECAVANLDELCRLLDSTDSNRQSTGKEAANVSTIEQADRVLREATARGALCRLGDMVGVTIGEVIGDTTYFVKQKDEWAALGIPPRHLQPIVTRMRQLAGLRVTKKEISALYGAIPLLLSLRGRTIPKRVQRYLDSYPLKNRLNNKTFAKRKPWYQVSYDSTALAFIGSISHGSPKVVLNSAGISCANGLYKLTPKSGRVRHPCIAAVSLTTVFRHSAELQARIRGSGALKLEPSDVANLLVPKNIALLDGAATRVLLARLDSLVRQGEYESATREADKALLLGTGALTASELNIIRDRFQDLRWERRPSKP
jgi:hypothetical protein